MASIPIYEFSVKAPCVMTESPFVVVTLKSPLMSGLHPDINGSLGIGKGCEWTDTNDSAGSGFCDGAFYQKERYSTSNMAGWGGVSTKFFFKASASNSSFGRTTTVQPSSGIALACIKI